METKHITIQIDHEYLLTCARIRNISITKLAQRLIDAIGRDQLVLAVLDDAEDYGQRERYQHRFRVEGYR